MTKENEILSKFKSKSVWDAIWKQNKKKGNTFFFVLGKSQKKMGKYWKKTNTMKWKLLFFSGDVLFIGFFSDLFLLLMDNGCFNNVSIYCLHIMLIQADFFLSFFHLHHTQKSTMMMTKRLLLLLLVFCFVALSILHEYWKLMMNKNKKINQYPIWLDLIESREILQIFVVFCFENDDDAKCQISLFNKEILSIRTTIEFTPFIFFGLISKKDSMKEQKLEKW